MGKDTKKEETGLEKKETTALAASVDYGKYGGTIDKPAAGTENITSEDLTVAFVTILQSMSEQIKPVAKGGIEGAEEGMICNTVTQEIVPGAEGFVFVPCYKEHVFTEWTPRSVGGEFVGLHRPGSDVVQKAKEESDDFGKYNVGNNELHENFNVYGMAQFGDGMFSPAVLRFKSMSIKKYKQWMNMATSVRIQLPNGDTVQPPLFAHKFRLTAVEDSKGADTFYNWSIRFDGGSAEAARLSPTSADFNMAAKFYEAMVEGTVKTPDYTEKTTVADSNDEGDEGDVPF